MCTYPVGPPRQAVSSGLVYSKPHNARKLLFLQKRSKQKFLSVKIIIDKNIENKKSFLSNRILTKYVVGANANPPKNANRPPKNGKVIPTNIVAAVNS